MRVYELARELELSSKELMARLAALGIEVASHMSALPDEAAELLREERLQRAADRAPPAPPKTPEIPPVEAVRPPPEPAPAEKAARPERQAVSASGKPLIVVRGAMVVRDFAEKLGVRPNRLIAELMKMNVFASISKRVEVQTMQEVAGRFGYTIEHEKKAAPKPAAKKEWDAAEETPDRPEDLLPRAPVVTFLGHVDHGKTSLLDKIRHSSVAAGEDGGITQHIGASTVDLQGRRIAFLDTPGHEAFTAMRARGANLTDIAVIIVAADDGIMPQTREAIRHARAANVSIMVAINKIDLPGANVDRVKQQLQAEGLTPDDWGGDIVCTPVSAMTGAGVDHLLEMILLQAEMLQLTANPRKAAQGFVIEAQMESGMGPTASLLVSAGTLKLGDVLLCGPHWGRVKALINDHGIKIKAAGPSTPVKCMGLSGVPDAGARFVVAPNAQVARDRAASAAVEAREQRGTVPRKASLDELFSQIQDNRKLELKVVLKADTQGSVEAITHALGQIKSDKVALNMLLASPGNITVNDVMLASASNAVILGFHVAKEPGVDGHSKREGVEIRLHQVIYELIERVQDAMAGLLAPELREKVSGMAEVRQVFSIGKTGNVAGCVILKGNVTPRFRVRIRRGTEVLGEDRIASLRHFQDEVNEVREGQECGIRLESFTAFAEGDRLELYEIEEIEQHL